MIRSRVLNMRRNNELPAFSFLRNAVTIKCSKFVRRVAVVKASRTVNLRVNSFRDSLLSGSKEDKCFRTGATDQVQHDLGVVGLSSKIPLMNLETTGKLPSCCPSNGSSCKREIKALYTPVVR